MRVWKTRLKYGESNSVGFPQKSTRIFRNETTANNGQTELWHLPKWKIDITGTRVWIVQINETKWIF